MKKFLKPIIIIVLVLVGIRFCNKHFLPRDNHVYSCEPLNQRYLRSEVILSKNSIKKGIKVLNAKAVRSPDYKQFYFVQYKLEIPGKGIVYPMFAMDKPFSSNSGVIYSMDDLAVSLTGFGDGRKTKANFSEFNRGFSHAKKCLK